MRFSVWKKLNQLKPLLGDEAERWKKIYLMEDEKGRRSIYLDLERVASKLLGDFGTEGLLMAPPEGETASGDPPLGTMMYGGKSKGVFFLRRRELTMHLLVAGDARSLAIGAASIVAKVTRDRWMEQLDAEFPHYGWASNKGYPTRDRIEALERFGYCKHRRRTFGPVRGAPKRAGLFGE